MLWPIRSNNDKLHEQLRYFGENSPRAGVNTIGKIVGESYQGIMFRYSPPGDDPEYWLIGTDAAASFSLMGMVNGYYFADGDSFVTAFERPNAFGTFHETGEDAVDLDDRIDQIYHHVRNLDFRRESRTLSRLFDWDSDKLARRFEAVNKGISIAHIIPDFADHMLPVVVSDGCYANCSPCPLRGSYSVRDMETIIASITELKQNIKKLHPGFMGLMTEAFVVSSSIGWMPQYSEDPNRATALGVAKALRSQFPSVYKLKAFIDTVSTNNAEPDYLINLARQYYSVIIGPETGNNTLSRFIEKPITTEAKINALKKLHEAGFYKVKATVLAGMVGEALELDGKRVYKGETAIRKTGQMILDAWQDYANRGSKFRHSVEVSRYVPVPGTPLGDLHLNPQNGFPRIRHYETDAGVQREIRILSNMLEPEGISVQIDYEPALAVTQLFK